MKFPEILELLRKGHKVRRASWSSTHVLMAMKLMDQWVLFEGPYNGHGNVSALSGNDVFADDWEPAYRDIMEGEVAQPALEAAKPEEGAL